MSAITGNSSIDLSLTNIWHAWRAFRRGKKPSRAILLFESELEYNLLVLARDLNTRTYRHGDYEHKIVNERKRRDIQVATVRDRVVHRLLYDYLMPMLNPRFDADVWSCRPGKGLHGALVRSQQLALQHRADWVYRGDVRKFFDHINHEVLRACLRRHVHDEAVLWLTDEVIASYAVTDRQTDRQTDWRADWQPHESVICQRVPQRI